MIVIVPLPWVLNASIVAGLNAAPSEPPASERRLNTVARAMWETVERTDAHPGTGSAAYCSAVSRRQASRTLRFAQRS